MVTIKNKTISDYNRGEITLKDVAQQLLDKFPITEIAEALAELLLAPNPEKVSKITVSEEELNQIVNLFRIRQTGTGRGRKKLQ